MELKLISDLHLYDNYMMEWRAGKYSSTLDYADKLVDDWNATTSTDDKICIVGDVGICNKRTVELLNKLNGHKILVIGNHDVDWVNNLYTTYNAFEAVYKELKQDNVLIKHTPGRCGWRGYIVHGHHHEYKTSGMRVSYIRYLEDLYRFNCSADIVGNIPRTLTELMAIKAIDKETNNGKKFNL